MNGVILITDTSGKDLGITIDRELKFHSHIANAVNKASRMLGLVKATFTCLDEVMVPRLFSAMVRPVRVWECNLVSTIANNELRS